MNTIRILAVVTLLLASRLAAAGNTFTVNISASKAKAAAVDACTPTAVAAPAAATDTLTVTLDAKLTTDLQLSVDGVGSVVVLAAGATTATFPAAKYADNRMLVMSAGKTLCKLMLAPAPGGAAEPPKPAEDPPAPVESTAFSALDQKARAFLTETKHVLGHEIVRDSAFSGRTFRIYHLPSGAPAFPLPRHVNEKDDVELWMVVPLGAKVSVDVTSCDKVPATRVSGTYKAAKEAVGRLESAEVSFGLEGYAKRQRCAGTLTYKIDMSYNGASASTSTSLAFDPVYRFEWGLGYVFDFARPRQLSLGDRPTEDGAGSEKFVVESKDYAGTKPILALSVNVCGTNPDDLTWCDRLFNPTLFVDPSRLKDGFGAGLMLRPFHGLGVLAGVTVFKSTEFADGAMAEVGDAWKIAGDLPTKETFNSDGVGFVMGVVVNTDVFSELLKSE
ncbi:MAG: hypothetical protein R3B48_23610 [Kofleriaceae bacterium]